MNHLTKKSLVYNNYTHITNYNLSHNGITGSYLGSAIGMYWMNICGPLWYHMNMCRGGIQTWDLRCASTWIWGSALAHSATTAVFYFKILNFSSWQWPELKMLTTTLFYRSTPSKSKMLHISSHPLHFYSWYSHKQGPWWQITY